LQFDRGYLSSYFINDADKQVALLDDPYVLLHDKKVSNIRELPPALEAVAKARPPAAAHPRGSEQRDGRLVGEDVWEPNPQARTVTKLDLADVISSQRAGEILAPYIKPLPKFDSATMSPARAR